MEMDKSFLPNVYRRNILVTVLFVLLRFSSLMQRHSAFLFVLRIDNNVVHVNLAVCGCCRKSRNIRTP